MLTGYSLGESETPCPYIKGETFRSENYYFESADAVDIDLLLSRGYRHFGKYFFRPVCRQCRRCIPIRIPVALYRFSRSAKRLIKKNAYLDVKIIAEPEASPEKYALYRKHKKRFSGEPSDHESYETFVESFYSNFPFSRTLEIRDHDKLVAVTHLDVGNTALSAIYCYYDTDYLNISPGRYSIYQGIKLAREMEKSYYYLGYYIKENRHMSYKGMYKPHEILSGNGSWVSGAVLDA